MGKRALVVLAEGFEDIEAVAPIDVLTRVGVEVTVASLKPGEVRAAYGSKLVPDTTLAEVSDSFDAVICPGGKANARALADSEQLRELIVNYFDSGKLVAAICAAPSHVLGESAQILKDKTATGDPGFMEKLSQHAARTTDGPVCVDGNVVTATGPGSALAFALTVASQLVGDDKVLPFAEKWGVSYPLGNKN